MRTPPKDRLNEFREAVNLRIFSSKKLVLRILTWLTLAFSIIALLAIVWYYGFPHPHQEVELIKQIVRFSFWFYILKYLIRVFFDFHPRQFIRQNWLEGILVAFLIFETLGYWILGPQFLSENIAVLVGMSARDLSVLIVQLYFFLIVLLELGHASVKLTYLRMAPSKMFLLSFALLIAAGSSLLMMPEMTTAGISLIDAVFTSTSAVCVTGLIVVDTASAFTHKGHLIIMILIQLGGINILAFAAFLATFYRDSASIKYQSLIKDLLSSGGLSQSRSILRNIFIFSFLIELAGVILIYFSWGREVAWPEGQSRLFYSLFHSISAFNNAGFSLYTNGLYEEGVRHAWGLHTVIAALIFLGGIGIPVLHDLAGLHKKHGKGLSKFRHLDSATKIVLRTSALLILGGAVAFYFLYPVHDSEVSTGGRIIQSVFQSVTARTAGFNTVDFNRLGEPLILVFIILMFIGASPGSTGGGIKTTTFAVILKSTLMGIRGFQHMEFNRHTLPSTLIFKAMAVAVIYAIFFITGSIALSIAEPDVPIIHLIFEEISALSTVGLTIGVTPVVGVAAKIILTLSMLIGRVGSLTIIMALLKTRKESPVKYPHAQVMIG